MQGGTESMLGYLEQAKDHDVAVSAMWIQDWSGKITTDFGTRGRREAESQSDFYVLNIHCLTGNTFSLYFFLSLMMFCLSLSLLELAVE